VFSAVNKKIFHWDITFRDITLLSKLLDINKKTQGIASLLTFCNIPKESCKGFKIF
jgi:hypothetical protein